MARRKHEKVSRNYDAVEPSRRRQKLQQREIINVDDDQFPSESRGCRESQQQDQTRTKGEEFDEQESPWSKLPDVVLEVVTGMDIGDRIQASRVCKYWRSSIAVARMWRHRRPASYGSPCFFSVSKDNNKKCVLTDPLRREHFFIDTPNLPEDTEIRYSDQGWLLLTTRIDFEKAKTQIDALLFNPLTGTTVRLPEFTSFYFRTFGFLSHPTSPECVVFCLSSADQARCTVVDYCKPGDEGWTSLIIRHDDGTTFRTSDRKPLWFKDRIYVLDDYRRVGVYDLFGGQTLNKVIGRPSGMGDVLTNNYVMNLVEMDDKVALVFVDFCNGLVQINVLDESEDRWIEVKSIGPETLLFCDSSGGVCMKKSTSSGPGGKVYARDSYCGVEIVSYCCASNKFVEEDVPFEICRKTCCKSVEEDVPFKICRKTCWIELKP